MPNAKKPEIKGNMFSLQLNPIICVHFLTVYIRMSNWRERRKKKIKSVPLGIFKRAVRGNRLKFTIRRMSFSVFRLQNLRCGIMQTHFIDLLKIQVQSIWQDYQSKNTIWLPTPNLLPPLPMSTVFDTVFAAFFQNLQTHMHHMTLLYFLMIHPRDLNFTFLQGCDEQSICSLTPDLPVILSSLSSGGFFLFLCLALQEAESKTTKGWLKFSLHRKPSC